MPLSHHPLPYFHRQAYETLENRRRWPLQSKNTTSVDATSSNLQLQAHCTARKVTARVRRGCLEKRRVSESAELAPAVDVGALTSAHDDHWHESCKKKRGG